MRETRRKFLSDTIFLTASQVLIRLRSLITLPVFARELGVEGYGIFTQINVTITLLIPFVSLRLDTAVIRFLAAEDDVKAFRNYYYTGLVLVVIGSIVVSFLLGALADISANLIFGDPNYANFMALSGVYLTTSTLYAYISNYYRTKQRIKFLALNNLSYSVLGILLMILVVSNGYGVAGAFTSLTVVNILYIIILSFLIGREIGWFGFYWDGLKRMLHYSIPLMPNSLLQWGVNYADRIVITHFLGLAAIGAYSASYSIGQLLNLLVTPVGLVLFPFISRFWDRGDIEETQRYFSYVTRYYILLGLPASVGLALLSQSLLGILTTTAFETSRLLVFWITFGFLAFGLYQINIYVFHLVGKTSYVTLTLVVGLAANLISNISLVPIFGLSGSAFATAITFFLMAIIAIYYGGKDIGYRIDWLAIAKSVIASAGMAGILLMLPMSSIPFLSLAVLVGAITYLAILILLRTFRQSEWIRLRRFIQSYLPR